MLVKTNQGIIIFLSALFILLIYQLSSILAPFIFAALLAYLMDPLVNRLEKHMPHLASVVIVFFTVFGACLISIIALTPLIEMQIEALITVIPDAMQWIQQQFIPWMQEYINISTLKTTLASSLPKPGTVMNTVLVSGYLIITWLINLVLIPVVTFYLLRDWDFICKKIETSTPKTIRKDMMKLMREFDYVLGAFFRGQFLVMLSLAVIYGVGLTLVGLQVGLVIGIIGGLLSIIPFLGSGFVLLTSTIVALVQFGNEAGLLYVWSVFLVGQALEGYALTPYFVGGRIGLHPVIVIFSILAGGTLFGFFGVLAALPVAALIKVSLRFIDVKYQIC